MTGNGERSSSPFFLSSLFIGMDTLKKVITVLQIALTVWGMVLLQKSTTQNKRLLLINETLLEDNVRLEQKLNEINGRIQIQKEKIYEVVYSRDSVDRISKLQYIKGFDYDYPLRKESE